MVVDRETLEQVTDSLYFALYEAAGTENLRFLKPNGGPLEPNDCDAIWCIKQFRLHARHDIDHGKEKSIDKKYSDLNAALAEMGLSRYPQDANEFRQLHRALFQRVVTFLQTLHERL